MGLDRFENEKSTVKLSERARVLHTFSYFSYELCGWCLIDLRRWMMIRATIIINTNAKKDAKTSEAVNKRGSFASRNHG